MNHIKPILSLNIEGIEPRDLDRLVEKIRDNEVSQQYIVFFTKGHDMLKVLNGTEIQEMSAEELAKWIKDSH